MSIEQTQKEMASYIGKLLRDNFGRGPESVFVTINEPFITIYLQKFLSPVEKVLMDEEKESVVQTTRDVLMKNLIPEMKANIRLYTGLEIEEFYYDWGLHNHSGVFIAVSSDSTKMDTLANKDYFGKDALHEEITNITQQVQRVPDEVVSCKLNNRTVMVIRNGIFISIERELIRMGYKEILLEAKRRMEKRLLHNSMRLESIFDTKIKDTFVSWDFSRDKSVMVFIIAPHQHGGNELDK
ncbi:DUF2294 domain-containing protein [Oceanobacillus halotolerans]|uniref:DUF2294 domain-containing protein n=1 Tax=Oceanobacillus halotolerans TaxID=2663380 RepID=UPI001CF7E7D8|nr:Na-translocating system protein MpsC family protein [Oceanobacillus halotolerans]